MNDHGTSTEDLLAKSPAHKAKLREPKRTVEIIRSHESNELIKRRLSVKHKRIVLVYAKSSLLPRLMGLPFYRSMFFSSV